MGEITFPQLTTMAIAYVVFVFSTTLHEAAHAFAAKFGGDRTAYEHGQASLNPLPHIQREPFGMVVLPLIGLFLSGWPIGYASAPYSRAWALNYPRRAGLMALAGPATNLALVVVAGVLIRLGIAFHLFDEPDQISFASIVSGPLTGAWPGIVLMLSLFFSLNLLLAVFNILPLPPLDGSTAIALVLPPAANAAYQHALVANPWLQIVGLLIAWFGFNYLFDPVFLLALNLLYPGSGYG
jgi:Zn-dependent protease